MVTLNREGEGMLAESREYKLSDMKDFWGDSLYKLMTVLAFPVVDSSKARTDDDVQNDTDLMDAAIVLLDQFNLTQTLKYARRTRDKFAGGGYSAGEFRDALHILRERADDELQDIKFMFIPKDDTTLYEQDMLFGSEVAAAFPSASYDIKEAGSCLATNRATASVFHQMRALEFGLRALAKDLKIRLPKKRHIDLEDWGSLIDAIEGKIATIERTRRRTAKREADLQFYHGAAAQFRHFKNAWRNHVMHSRVNYEQEDAARALRHVDEFMRHIATRLKQPTNA